MLFRATDPIRCRNSRRSCILEVLDIQSPQPFLQSLARSPHMTATVAATTKATCRPLYQLSARPLQLRLSSLLSSLPHPLLSLQSIGGAAYATLPFLAGRRPSVGKSGVESGAVGKATAKAAAKVTAKPAAAKAMAAKAARPD